MAILELAPERAVWICNSLRRCGWPDDAMVTVRIHAGDTGMPWPVAAVVASGGPGSVLELGNVSERGQQLRDALRLLQQAVAGAVPVLGICMSHQLLASCGGVVGPRAAGMAVGFEAVCLKHDEIFAGMPRRVQLAQYHHDEVCEVPAGWSVVASSASCGVEAMRMRGHPVWGVQGHPELPAGFVRILVQAARGPSGGLAAYPTADYETARLTLFRNFSAIALRLIAAKKRRNRYPQATGMPAASPSFCPWSA